MDSEKAHFPFFFFPFGQLEETPLSDPRCCGFEKWQRSFCGPQGCDWVFSCSVKQEHKAQTDLLTEKDTRALVITCEYLDNFSPIAIILCEPILIVIIKIMICDIM